MMRRSGSSFLQRPNSQQAWWAVSLAAAFIVMNILNALVFMRLPADVPWRQTVLPFYGVFMMLCGLAAGFVGLIALLRKRERSWLVLLAILPGVFALVFLLGEFLGPH